LGEYKKRFGRVSEMAWKWGINAEIAINIEVMSSLLTPLRMKRGRQVTNGMGKEDWGNSD